jgi:hypothetical protein
VIIVGVGADRALDNQRGQARIKFEF